MSIAQRRGVHIFFSLRLGLSCGMTLSSKMYSIFWWKNGVCTDQKFGKQLRDYPGGSCKSRMGLSRMMWWM